MSTPPSDSKPLVLLVDDDDDSRFLYAEYLTSLGSYRIAEAGDGRQALEMAVALKPGAIVLDMSLPFLDGREVARALRLDPSTREIAILALTGYADMKASDGSGGDFQMVLVKPCLPEALTTALETVLRARPQSPESHPVAQSCSPV